MWTPNKAQMATASIRAARIGSHRRRAIASRSAERIMKNDFEDDLQSLADRWCERKALRSLHHFLPGYFALNGMTDGYAALQEALKDVLAFAKDEITEAEYSEVKRIIALVQGALSDG
jgi:hypothetical protein